MPLFVTTAAIFAWSAAQANAAELVAFSAAAVKSSLVELPASFQQQTGVPLHLEFGTAGVMQDKALKGAAFDVIILTPATMKELEKRALVDGKSEFTLGTASLGAAVIKGQTVPDIHDEAALRQALLAAPSIGIADPASGATTGVYLARLFDKLGITQQISGKLKVYPDGQNAMQAVARGEVYLAMGQISEALPVAGLAPLQPLPDAAQLYTVYVAAMAASPANPEAAAKLLATLKSSAFQASLRSNGITPPR